MVDTRNQAQQQAGTSQTTADQPQQDPVEDQPQQLPVQPTVQYIYAGDMSSIKPPNFDWDSNDLPQQFKKFRRYCELMLSTPSFSGRSGHEIVSCMLLWMGPQAVEIFDNWTTLSEAQKVDPTHIWNQFQLYFEPKSNFRLARFQLRDLRQEPQEPVDSFLTRLRSQAAKCSFINADLVDDNIIDQLIKGTAHGQVRKKLLDHDPKGLTLDKAVDFSRTFEATEIQLRQFGDTNTNIAAIKKQKKFSADNAHRMPSSKQCLNCGTQHKRHECPAKGRKCHKCHRIGHFGTVCLNPNNPVTQAQPAAQSKQRYGKKTQKNIRSIDNADDAPDHAASMFDQMAFDVIRIDANTSGKRTTATATIRIEPYPNIKTNLRGKVDTGAEGNLLPLRTFRQIFPRYISPDGLPMKTTPSTAVLTDYNGGKIPQYGTITLPCQYNEVTHNEKFYIADAAGPVIFGLQTCERLGLVKMNCSITSHTITSIADLKESYPDRFQGLGKFPNTHHLIVDETITPVKHAPRRAPIQLREKIKTELERMVELNVIRPVEEPTDWVSSITFVHKADGSLRICLDPKDLNNALKRGKHHTPTVEEITHQLANATHFSKLDAKSGYWSVQLDSSSQLLTTFNTPFGRYCFQRLPFGLKTSQDVFQRAMDDILDGLQGVLSIADDITVYGKSEQEHDENLHNMMKRAEQKGLVFNPHKCFIKTSEIPFFGNIYSKDGVRPDPAKVQAIDDIAIPTNVTELQSFLGMITYLSTYIPNLSSHTTPLRQLLHKDSEFQWHHEHQDAFEKIKNIVKNASTLVYFNPKKPTVIQVDASSYALGAALVQNDKVIAYASKSLTETEQRYANIEREMLACVFGAERFHTYVYGEHFTIQSDHRPLEMIAKKSLTAAPARLQRMLLRLQRYSYTIQYRPGREMTLADSLSRIPTTRPAQEIKLDLHVSFILFSDDKLQQLREETKKDIILNELSKHIMQGFPKTIRDLHPSIRPFWSFRDELSIEDGVILKGEQTIIPKTLQKQYITIIHEGHQGITRCQQRAKSTVYWPGINDDIIKLVSMCQQCQTHQASQSKETLLPLDIPAIPWHTISTDLFTLDGEMYLIIADYHSKYPIVEKLQRYTSKTVTNITEKYFAMFGYPNTIISDNGPQFNGPQFIGQEYRAMVKEHNISHVTSSPHHAQSHGFIERMIRTVKALFSKTTKHQKALLMYRTTPLGPSLPSPAEILFGRRVRSNLPVHISSSATEQQRVAKEKTTQQMEEWYNQKSKPLQELNIDDAVYYQDVAKRTWSPGVIIGKGPEPRSYTVECSTTGRDMRRNRHLIRQRHVPDIRPTADDNIEMTIPSPSQEAVTEGISAVPSPRNSTTPTSDSNYQTNSGRVSNPPKRLVQE
jgi:transposase InsO family protein